MGEFDDVLAMESGDEWADYEGGLEVRPAAPAPLVAALGIPGATVLLRGAVPAVVLDALAALMLPVPESPDSGSLVTLTVEQVGTAHSLVDADRGPVGTVASPTDLTGLLVDHLLGTAETVEPRHVHLRAGAVQLPEGAGVLVIGDDANVRHAALSSLVECGATLLASDRAVLVPGSCTVLAFPTPTLRAASSNEGGGAASTPTPAAAPIDAVVVLDTGADAVVEQLGRPHGCALLLADQLPHASDPLQMLHTAADLSAAVDFWSVPSEGAEPVGRLIEAIVGDRDDRREPDVVVTRRLSGHDEDLFAVRFARGGVLVDLGAIRALEIAEQELPVLDRLGWSQLRPVQGVDREVVDALAAAGIDVRAAIAPRRSIPGPQTFGLPDSPTGVAAQAAWRPAAARAMLSEDPQTASVLSRAVAHGELAADAPFVAELADAARRVLGRSAEVSAALSEVVELLEAHHVTPLVLDPVVHAVSGLLPTGMVPAQGIDLLVGRGQLAQCAELLVAAGAERSPGDDRTDRDPATPMRLVGPVGQVQVVLHDRLAVGPFGELVDHDELHARSVPLAAAGRLLRALHPDDRFVWACVRLEVAPTPTWSAMREVVLAAPRSQVGMVSALDTAERWGATHIVLAAVRTTDSLLPGLSPWLSARAQRDAGAGERRRRRGTQRI